MSESPSDISLEGYVVNCFSSNVAPPLAGHRGMKPLLRIFTLSVGRICPATGGTIRQSLFSSESPAVGGGKQDSHHANCQNLT